MFKRDSCWRRKRDLNPRYGFPYYSLSRGAPSASWVFLRDREYLSIKQQACQSVLQTIKKILRGIQRDSRYDGLGRAHPIRSHDAPPAPYSRIKCSMRMPRGFLHTVRICRRAVTKKSTLRSAQSVDYSGKTYGMSLRVTTRYPSGLRCSPSNVNSRRKLPSESRNIACIST